jgi:hypothetical protein
LGTWPPFKLASCNEITRIFISIRVIGSPVALFNLFALGTMETSNTADDFLIDRSHFFERLSVGRLLIGDHLNHLVNTALG